jgi:hypothetical protein
LSKYFLSISQGFCYLKDIPKFKIKLKRRKNTHQGHKRKFLNKKDPRKKRKRIEVQTKRQHPKMRNTQWGALRGKIK